MNFQFHMMVKIQILDVSSGCVLLNAIKENQTIIFHSWGRVQMQGNDTDMKDGAQYQMIWTILFYLVLKHTWVTQSAAVQSLEKLREW